MASLTWKSFTDETIPCFTGTRPIRAAGFLPRRVFAFPAEEGEPLAVDEGLAVNHPSYLSAKAESNGVFSL